MHAPKHADHYLVLDAARGIAALIIVFVHLRNRMLPYFVDSFGEAFLQKGFLAVDLFFLMSGLVICRAYEEKILTKSISFTSFFLTRLIRLWPLYALGTLLGLIYAWAMSYHASGEVFNLHINAISFVFNIFFLPSPINDVAPNDGLFRFNAASWSLFLEVAINLAYALYAVRFSTLKLSVIAVIAGSLLVVTSLAYGSTSMGWNWTNMHGGICRITFSFTLGILLCRFIRTIKMQLPSYSAPLLLFFLCAVLTTPFGKTSIYYDWACIFFIFPVFVFLSCFAIPLKPLAFFFHQLGRISYSVYILNMPLLFCFISIYHALGGQQPIPWTVGSLFIVSILVVSYLVCVLYDEPIRVRIRAWLARRYAF